MTKVNFNEVAGKGDPCHEGLTLAVRSDEQDVTAAIKRHLIEYLQQSPQQRPFFDALARRDRVSLEKVVEDKVYAAYSAWTHGVLKAMGDDLDYSLYNIKDKSHPVVDVNFYSADKLAEESIQKGEQLVRQAGHKPGVPVLYVSLDDLIKPQSGHWSEIAISREFALNGDQLSYQARPGKKPLEEQMSELAQAVEKLKKQSGADIPIVLIEDNVRRANMLNWLIDLMDKNKVFDSGTLAGIATCFCVAAEEERQKIIHNGKVVPVTAAIDFKDRLTDVVTPRDLLFDGHVVQIEGKMARLPGIFMDVVKLFKISPDKADDFRGRVDRINIEFCNRLTKDFGVTVPMSWFEGAAAIAHVTGLPPETPMAEVIAKQQSSYRQNKFIARPNAYRPG